MNNFEIRGPRQQRAIALLLAGAVMVKDMGPKIGALNPRQVISELRRQGFQEIIQTRRYTIVDQDGRRCRPGEYYIPHGAKPMVEQALTGYVVQLSNRLAESTQGTHNNNNNGRI